MSYDCYRRHCATRPAATMDVKWGADEVYSVGGKMFAVFGVEGGAARSMSFKCDPHRFLELTDLPGIVPAPYLARAHWIQVLRADALPRAQLVALLDDSHARVLARLPKRTQAALLGATPATPRAPESVASTRTSPRNTTR